jgi:nucleoside-diphosphate-sugar epimerase
MTTIAVTGAGGYVGGVLADSLERHGFDVVMLSRAGFGRRFELSETPAADLLAGVDGLIHCAWDLRARGAQARRINVEGSLALLQAAHTAGVSRVVFISSMAAYPGCRSMFGQAKLEVEAAVLRQGGVAVRPGLLFGKPAGGLLQTLERMVVRSSVLPLVGGSAMLPLLHIDDLGALVLHLLSGQATVPALYSAAHPDRVPFRTVLRTIATVAGRKVTFIPVPARWVLAALRAAEACGVALRTGSDNLVSLLHQNPHPDLNAETLGVRLRPFNTTTLVQ